MSDKISYSQYAVVDLLDAFASNEPVPGGGSAAALAGALGVSLLMMVADLPRTRTGQPEETADLAEAASRFRPLREQLIELVDRDSEAYRLILNALRLPKSTDSEKAARAEAIRSGTRTATDVPLETMRACQQALAGAVIVARNGHVAAASDVGMAIELLAAALKGCGLSIDVNLKGFKDADYSSRVMTERTQLEMDGVSDAAKARQLLPL